MFGPLRSLVAFALLALAVWAAFTVRLGRRTLAEHMDRIGQTREAKELVEGTRKTVTPALQEARDRLVGEYVEAPTAIAGARAFEPQAGSRTEGARSSLSAPVSSLAPSSADSAKLPGRDRPREGN